MASPAETPLSEATDVASVLQSAIELKNFAVRRGLPVPDALLKNLSEISASFRDQEHAPDVDCRLDALIRDLTNITWPTTTRTLEFSAQKGNTDFFQKHFRGLLFALLLFALFLSIGSLIAASGEKHSDLGEHLFPLALGLLGSTTYIFFSLMNVVSERAIDESDVFSSYARLMLGPAFGWLFAQVFNVSVNASNTGNAKSQLLLLIPFVAGFSTRLVLGIINQSIQAIEITLGLNDKRTELKSRNTTRR